MTVTEVSKPQVRVFIFISLLYEKLCALVLRATDFLNSFRTLENTNKDGIIDLVFNCRLLTAEVQVLLRPNLCGIYGGLNGTETSSVTENVIK